MSTTGRPTRNRTLPAGLALVLLVLGIPAPPLAAECGMAMDRAPSGSVAAPDCCTDRSCPRMAVASPRPEGITTTPTALVAPVSAGGTAELSPPALFSPVMLPSRIFRDRLLGPPLRI